MVSGCSFAFAFEQESVWPSETSCRLLVLVLGSVVMNEADDIWVRAKIDFARTKFLVFVICVSEKFRSCLRKM